MNEEQSRLIAENFSALWDAAKETAARLSAQRYLLEQLYANAFIGDPAGMNAMLNGVIEKTRTGAQRPESMSVEDQLDQQARIANHLDRFRLSVLQRIQDDRSTD